MFNLSLQLRPAGESVLTGDRTLSRRERRPICHRLNAIHCGRIALLGFTEQFARLMPELVEVGTVGGSGMTPPSHARVRVRARSEDGSCQAKWSNNRAPVTEVDSVLPANPAAPSRAECRLPLRLVNRSWAFTSCPLTHPHRLLLLSRLVTRPQGDETGRRQNMSSSPGVLGVLTTCP